MYYLFHFFFTPIFYSDLKLLPDINQKVHVA